jgi:hypothetical protein
VLISMGILTIGLLGVAALFPVGGFYMHKADVADRASAIAQSVMSDIVARGLLNPFAWYVAAPPTTTQIYPSDGAYAPNPPITPPFDPSEVRGLFTRPFALTLGEALNQPVTGAPDATRIGKEFGSAYVIDPMGVAAMSFYAKPPTPPRSGPAITFPAAAWGVFNAASGFYPSSSYSPWYPWNGMWPVRRVTFRESTTGWQLGPTMAEHYFRASDDLSSEFPKRDDRPAQQTWDTADFDQDGAREPLARQWVGDYSWIVTVAPTTNAARDGLARNPEGHSYDVSVVVFYKRVLPPGATTVYESFPVEQGFRNAMSENERAVKAKIISTGLNGGEILLDDLADNPDKNAFQHLKTGHWVMLCGPHPNSNVDGSTDPPTGEPRFSLNWYQVISIEGRDTQLDEEGNEMTGSTSGEPPRRLITVRGPQWPWTPGGYASENLCVAICRGAVAVHAKTMRLEKNLTMRFGASGSPGKTPPPYGWN